MIAILIRFSVLTALVALGTASASGQAFDAGATMTMNVNSDGTLSIWGYVGYGQLSQMPGGNDFTAVAAGRDHAAAIRADGTLESWGFESVNPIVPYESPPAGNSYTAIASGYYHTLALRADGTVASWGAKGSAKSNVPENLSGVTAISVGMHHSLALKDDGTVVAWGYAGDGRTTVPDFGENVKAIAVAGGGHHSLALLSNGTVEAWGLNTAGQSTVPSQLSGVAAIAAGESHSLALHSNGTVTQWGTIVAEPNRPMVPQPAELSDVVYVNAGWSHNYAILSDGTYANWGRNGSGQLSTPPNSALPTVARWSTATSGDYLHSHRWEQQIPSTKLSTAVFDQAGTYTVSFGNDARASNLHVSAGDVTFAQNGNAYQVENALNVTGTNTTLRVDGLVTASSVTNQGLIHIASGGEITAGSLTNTGTIRNDGVLNASVTMAGGGTFSGNGEVSGMLTVADGASLAPGASVGSLRAGDTTFGAGGIFDFEIKDALAVPDGPLGWDTLQLNGQLQITATPADKFIVNVSSLNMQDASGTASNFDPKQDYSWAFVTAAEGIEGFDAGLFAINSSGFQNSLDGGHFSIGHVGNSLTLQFNSSLSAVPEPSSLVVLGICGIGWAGYRARNRNRKRVASGAIEADADSSAARA
ncbi:RCC1 domain-containing protein [Candidatus Laterigemmans baculatus]|uniref:RCC1 domain-containing protein n=1 Tax=Candidatus Laterigemmans baculatus TaxID=2770505 RepID=UPI0013DB7EBF|nr:hypothetical protein [Candidatus Laterigemmans baculatus]